MKYDILLSEQNQVPDPIIDAYFKVPANPYIFYKIDLEKSIKILAAELIDHCYSDLILVPRLDNDQFNVYELLKSPHIIGSIEGNWNKESSIHLLRIRKCINESNHNLIEKINYFPELIALEDDRETSNLVENFISHSYKNLDSLEIKMWACWINLLESYLSFKPQ